MALRDDDDAEKLRFLMAPFDGAVRWHCVMKLCDEAV